MCKLKTAQTLGHEFLLTLYLWYARPAFSMGFSVRPPPDTCPTVARHVLGITCTLAALHQSQLLNKGFTLFLWQAQTSQNTHCSLPTAAEHYLLVRGLGCHLIKTVYI